MATMAAILEFQLEMFKLFFILSHPMLPTKFRINWPFISGEEAKNRFSRWIGTILATFDLQVIPGASYQVLSELAFRFRGRSEKQIFKMVAILDFQSEGF